jgi:protein phosphatase
VADAARTSAAPAAAAPPVRRRRLGRKAIGAILALAIIAALAIGLYAGSRQFYFLGTDDHGVVTLFRGLPYELPAGVDLYTVQYRTAVPARALRPVRRKQLLDHKLRGKGDATDLVRQIEQGKVR